MDREAIKTDLSRKLRALRQERGLSLGKLSEELYCHYNISISEASLKNYEAGEFTSRAGSCIAMKLEYLCCLADFYGVSFDYLLTPGSSIRSPNIETQAIGIYTGLSQTSVERLSDGFPLEPGYQESLDSVLSSDWLGQLLNAMQELKAAIKNADAAIPRAKKSNLDGENTVLSLRYASDRLDYSLWNVSRAMTDICKEAYPIDQKQKMLLSALEEVQNGEHQEN